MDLGEFLAVVATMYSLPWLFKCVFYDTYAIINGLVPLGVILKNLVDKVLVVPAFLALVYARWRCPVAVLVLRYVLVALAWCGVVGIVNEGVTSCVEIAGFRWQAVAVATWSALALVMLREGEPVLATAARAYLSALIAGTLYELPVLAIPEASTVPVEYRYVFFATPKVVVPLMAAPAMFSGLREGWRKALLLVGLAGLAVVYVGWFTVRDNPLFTAFVRAPAAVMVYSLFSTNIRGRNGKEEEKKGRKAEESR